jgi:hypothetical protein
MKLADLREGFDTLSFPEAASSSSPARDTVLEARKLVASAVLDDEFLVDCFSLELQRLGGSMGRGLAPFFKTPGTGIRLAFGYWPPGSTATPHEHTAWTITAVCRNELDVKTFDRDESYRTKAFVPKNLFKASKGAVGFIFDPCIHEPMNTSDEWSLSLHVTSPRDGVERRDAHALWAGQSTPGQLEDPLLRVLEARKRHDFVHLLAQILAPLESPNAKHVLRQCLSIASSATRRHFGQEDGNDDKGRWPWRLARVHPDLELRDVLQDGTVSLDAHMSEGMMEGLVVSDVARHALAFVAKTPRFDVQSLPGSLTASERRALAEALEETGFFVRVQE